MISDGTPNNPDEDRARLCIAACEGIPSDALRGKKVELNDWYKEALVELEQIMDANPDKDSPQGKRVAELSDALSAYEDVRYCLPEKRGL